KFARRLTSQALTLAGKGPLLQLASVLGSTPVFTGSLDALGLRVVLTSGLLLRSVGASACWGSDMFTPGSGDNEIAAIIRFLCVSLILSFWGFFFLLSLSQVCVG